MTTKRTELKPKEQNEKNIIKTKIKSGNKIKRKYKTHKDSKM
jgi:hypothetical protein